MATPVRAAPESPVAVANGVTPVTERRDDGVASDGVEGAASRLRMPWRVGGDGGKGIGAAGGTSKGKGERKGKGKGAGGGGHAAAAAALLSLAAGGAAVERNGAKMSTRGGAPSTHLWDGRSLVGQPTRKFFARYGTFNGTVTGFDESSKQFTVRYVDGDEEDMSLSQLQRYLLADAIPLAVKARLRAEEAKERRKSRLTCERVSRHTCFCFESRGHRDLFISPER